MFGFARHAGHELQSNKKSGFPLELFQFCENRQ